MATSCAQPAPPATTVGLTRLGRSSQSVRCPSCGKTGKTLRWIQGKSDTKRRAAHTLTAVGLALSCCCAAVLILPVALRALSSTIVTHYCRHCRLRLAQHTVPDDTTHVFSADHLSLPRGHNQRSRPPNPIPSPLGPAPPAPDPPDNDLLAIPTLHRESIPVRTLLPTALPRTSPAAFQGDIPILREAAGPAAPFFTVLCAGLPVYAPRERETAARDPAAPHARVFRCVPGPGGQEGGREVARVWLGGANLRAEVEFVDKEGEGEGGAAGGHGSGWAGGEEKRKRGRRVVMGWVRRCGWAVESSRGPLLWCRRGTVGDAECAGEVFEERCMLLDAYDRLVAMEVQVGMELQLRLYGHFSQPVVDEIVASYVVKQIQEVRESEYSWQEMAKCVY